MKNADCNFKVESELNVIMKKFPYFLTDAEEETARKYFNQIVFFKAIDRTTRRVVCTSCMEGFIADKEISPDFFKKKHGDNCECPNCGQAAVLNAMGKFKNYESLKSHIRGVQVSAYNGGLLIQAGWITRAFDDEDLGGTIDFEPYKRFYFAPGKRAAWEKRVYNYFGELHDVPSKKEWILLETIREPFQSRPYEREPAYAVLGYENIEKTPMKYCQYDAWFDDTYGAFVGSLEFEEQPFHIAYLIKYLAEYTRRPQMEILAKLGHMSLLTELVRDGRPNANYVDWKAKNPAAFFRLSKADYIQFKEIDINLEILRDFRKMRKLELIKSLNEFSEAKKRTNRLFNMLCSCSLKAEVSFERAENYINSFTSGCSHGATPISTILTCWNDYLDAAKTLKYNLRRDDVRMPRDLSRKHDEATAGARVVADEKAIKQYAKRYSDLARQFEFSDSGLSIVAPMGVAEIVEEGSKLEHCVGGYAERHITGKLTILFLRPSAFTSVPFVTIELTAELNCEKLEIKQIHGYKNESGGIDSPRIRYKTFLSKWLDWVHAGSRRDENGNPVIEAKPKSRKIKKETNVA